VDIICLVPFKSRVQCSELTFVVWMSPKMILYNSDV